MSIAKPLESAITAAVPSMLAGLGGLASQEEGIRKLSSTLGSLDDTMFGNFDRLLSGDTGTMLQKGSGLLQGLFGDGLSSNLATAVSRFTGLDAGIVKSLLAYSDAARAGPRGQPVAESGRHAGGLKTLFADQTAIDRGRVAVGIRARRCARPAADGRCPPGRFGRGRECAQRSQVVGIDAAAAGAVDWGRTLVVELFQQSPQPQEAGVKPALDETESVVAMKPVRQRRPASRRRRQ